MSGGRILAIDWGEKRIGLAISSEDRVFAFPFRTLPNDGDDAVCEAIRHIVDLEGVSLVLVGMPLTGQGARGRQAEVIAAFTETLRTRLSVPVVFEDERLSTKAAERQLRQGRKRKGERADGILDQHAAQVILQGYLERNRRGGTTV